MQIDTDVALAAVITAEIEYAKQKIELGSTLTRVTEQFENDEAICTVFVTTTLKRPGDAQDGA